MTASNSAMRIRSSRMTLTAKDSSKADAESDRSGAYSEKDDAHSATNGSTIDDAVRSVGKPVRRKGSRRVVMLSEVDAERIKSGEFESAEEVLQASDHKRRLDPKGHATPTSGKGSGLSARDREILDDVPPHFGNL